MNTEPAQENNGQQIAEEEKEQESSLEDQISELKHQLKDQLLRSQADMENLRKRMSREMEKASSFAIESFARDLLPVLDNMNRVLATLDEESDNSLKDGVRLTLREMQAILTRHHVVRIEAIGQMFDPHLHEALFEKTDPKAEAGTITEIIEDGYMIGARLLRPARVGVTRAAQPLEAQTPETRENPPKKP